MRARRTIGSVLLALSVSAGLAVVGAPAAHAAGASACTYNMEDWNAVVDSGTVRYRTGPGTNYATKGQLYNGDRLRVYCGKSNWFYTKLTARSKSGMAKGTAGWVRGDLIWQVS